MRKIEKFLFGKIETWILLLVIVLALAGAIGWASLAMLATIQVGEGEHPSGITRLAFNTARIPTLAKGLVDAGLEWDPHAGLVTRNEQILDFNEFSGLDVIDPDFEEDGLLLVSAYSREDRISTVYLYDLRDRTVPWSWVPPYDEIYRDTAFTDHFNSRRLFSTQHPLLFADGSIVTFSGSGPLVRFDRESQLQWKIERHFHHTIEFTPDGNIIVPDSRQGGWGRDDGYAIVSPDGEILDRHSIAEILIGNGYRGLFYGVGRWENDRIHLNDAEIIGESDPWVQAGDVMLSIRHLSTVMLYRPSEARVIWLKTGPWLNQHDIDYLGEGRFAIFGNDMVRGLTQTGDIHSTIYVFDTAKGVISKPWEAAFAKHRLYTESEGLQRILPNGDAFIEIQNEGILYRISPTGIRWRYVHTLDEETIGIVHWCRYYLRSEIEPFWENHPQPQPQQ